MSDQPEAKAREWWMVDNPYPGRSPWVSKQRLSGEHVTHVIEFKAYEQSQARIKELEDQINLHHQTKVYNPEDEWGLDVERLKNEIDIWSSRAQINGKKAFDWQSKYEAFLEVCKLQREALVDIKKAATEGDETTTELNCHAFADNALAATDELLKSAGISL